MSDYNINEDEGISVRMNNKARACIVTTGKTLNGDERSKVTKYGILNLRHWLFFVPIAVSNLSPARCLALGLCSCFFSRFLSSSYAINALQVTLLCRFEDRYSPGL